MSLVPVPVLRLRDAWRQAERHVHHMQHAMFALAPLLPLDEARFTGLTDEQIQDVDQFILRFSKLQDVLGVRLFPALAAELHDAQVGQVALFALSAIFRLRPVPA